MIRVLHVLGGLGSGGTESLIMNWYRNIDRTKIQFDFLVRSFDNNYLEEIMSLGGRVYYTASFPRHFAKNYRETRSILKRQEWDVIHVHGNAAMYMLPLTLAKKMGYPCRIMHSHSVKAQNNIYALIHYINKKRIPRLATHYLACSQEAGMWMFGNTPYILSRNAIDLHAYRFDSETRSEYKKMLNLENKFVVGHVGRMAYPKNHGFILDIFKEFQHKRPDSVLMLVGDGELESQVREKAKRLGLSDSVVFTGRRSDVGKLMSVMDLFLLPSLYEGLSVVLVEAQCNGLPCIVSEEGCAKEAVIYPELMTVLSLGCGASQWAELLHEKADGKFSRYVDINALSDHGFNMKTEIARLEKLYLQMEKGTKE